MAAWILSGPGDAFLRFLVTAIESSVSVIGRLYGRG